jgi:hypothetical protein
MSTKLSLGWMEQRAGVCCGHIFLVRLRRIFGEELMLRRHDYSVNIGGGFRSSQLTSDYVEANGIYLPTKRRAYTRGPDHEMLMDRLISARFCSSSEVI